MRKWAALVLVMLAAACNKKQAPPPPPPPPPPQNVFALLPETDKLASGIVVSNAGGRQEVTQPNTAVNVQNNNTAPGAPYALTPDDVRRLFGSALDMLPAAQVRFALYFDEQKDDLNAASLAQLAQILSTVQERHSTAITVTGHADATGDPKLNYDLGLRRAEKVAGYLIQQGLDQSSLIVESHGDADPAVQKARGQREPLNRRVEVIVR